MASGTGRPVRAALVAVVLLSVFSAGCLSGVQEAPGATNETDDATVNGAEAAQNESERGANDTASDDESLPAVNTTAEGLVGDAAVESPLSPKPFPEHPEQLTANATEQFAVEYEVAYLWNTRLDDETAELDVRPFDNRSRPTEDGGFVVTFDVGYSQYTKSNAVGDGGYTVHYFVNETVVQRSLESSEYRAGEGLDGATTLERCPQSCAAD